MLQQAEPDQAACRELISNAIEQHRLGLYTLDHPTEEARSHLEGLVPQILAWKAQHLNNSDGCVIEPTGSSCASGAGSRRVRITSIEATEENIWSPAFGLKGKVDATLMAQIQQEDGSWQSVVLPLELKTGKPSFLEHRGQVILYAMMLAER